MNHYCTTHINIVYVRLETNILSCHRMDTMDQMTDQQVPFLVNNPALILYLHIITYYMLHVHKRNSPLPKQIQNNTVSYY